MHDPAADAAVAHFRHGNERKDAGEPEAALASYDLALAQRPAYPQALCNRGVVLAAMGRLDAALDSYDRALTLDPRDAICHYNRAGLLVALRRWDAALAGYDRVVELDPGAFHAHFQRGNILRELQQLPAAIAAYAAAIAARPDFAAAHFNRGVVLQATGEAVAALADYERALALDGTLVQAHYSRGNLLQELGRSAEALAGYEAALALREAYPEAWCNRGVALRALGRPQDALASFERAVALRPGYAGAWFNRGALLRQLGRYTEALASQDSALAIRSDYAESWCERGAALLGLQRPQDALDSFDRALALQPALAEAHYNRALTLLLCGDYPAGWLAHEWRWKTRARRAFSDREPLAEPLWLGREDLRGRRILLWSEQGLGDTLQFCRYAELVAARGAHVILEVQAPLVGLLRSLAGVADVVARGTPLPRFDLQCPLMSLPLAFGTTLDSVPARPGYLRCDPALATFWRGRLGPRQRPRIGLVWSGNSAYGNDLNRSVPLADWIAWLPREFEYYCLQRDIRDTDRRTLAASPWIAACDDEYAGFDYTAALIGELDLVASVDTSIAHLAAGLGQQTWLLQAYNPDWRWMLERADSPWYPTLRLFRQPAAGDWRTVYQRIGAELRRYFGAAG
jgi:tetratricopeptide (TPR) repeat protein